CLQSSNWPYSF
nr:immunoglobulin light chain junction region [Macaca mulatta]MOV61109.1 immunoglobulin light chain junction region [Macaca mulatta]MOV61358.1 immunoglobulin light chain junction region [Macaca mulatta]MOV61623.1 immunoglobulin light chain junction region [Macaca mulatta]MOV61722.1 immunoglobulin light chain junction region [Macaca mulatta]